MGSGKEGVVKGKTKISKYIDMVLPNLNISSPEKQELVSAVMSKHGKNVSEENLLKEIVHFLDNRPLFTRNLLNIEHGRYRTMEGNADEMIVVGKLIKMGFNCSRVDVTNSKYDAVIDRDGKLLRVQIKATGTNTLDLTSGARAGQQISRDVPSRQKKLSEKDCDVVIGVLKTSAICYVIPAKDLGKFGNSVSLSRLAEYKEKWENIK